MAGKPYRRPTVTDYGDLVRITEVMHPKLAMSVSDLSFSAPQQGVQGDTFGSSPPGAYSGAPQVAGTTHHASTSHGGGGIGGTTAGGAGGLTGSAGGGGRTLPFTGFAAGTAAAPR